MMPTVRTVLTEHEAPAAASPAKMRSLLFIAPAFPPLNSSGTQRGFHFARRLPDYGWLPIVVTLDWEREPLGNPLDYEPLAGLPPSVPVYPLPFFNPPLRWGEWLRRVRQHGGGAVMTDNRNGDRDDHGRERPATKDHGIAYRLARGLYHFSIAPLGDEHFYWAMRVRGTCEEIARRHRVAAIWVSVSPWSAALLGLSLRDRLQVPLIVDFRDYWTGWAVREGPLLRDRWDRHAERHVLSTADRVVCVHTAMARDFEAMVPSLAGRCHVITNGFDPADFASSKASEKSGLPRDEGGPLLVHTGVAWGDAALPMLRAVRLERDKLRELRLRVRFVGGLPAECERFVAREGLQDLVSVLPRAPHRTALEEMASADALLVLLVNKEGGRKWYPGKLFEYLAARKPIIAVAPEGIATDLVREMKAGVTLNPDHPLQIAQALVSFARDPRAFRAEHYSLREDALKPFERGELAAQLAALLHLTVGD